MPFHYKEQYWTRGNINDKVNVGSWAYKISDSLNEKFKWFYRIKDHEN